ncbi:MAG: phycobiliprotein lyase [Moorea sp. SIO2B7]|nr:phycobiliprotein lyase [Moorena sp. SIO2B7]
MTSAKIAQLSTESLVEQIFRQSEGHWNSQRRYYTLKQEVEPQEVVTFLTVRFLEQGSPELVELARLHQLDDEGALKFGSEATWESNYTGKTRKPSQGSTVFGVRDNIIYRDRGFSTHQPITATYFCPNPQTLCLKTEYGKSVFEEELKLIGENYRTRQTIILRTGQEQMIGQYLEKRIYLEK